MSEQIENQDSFVVVRCLGGMNSVDLQVSAQNVTPLQLIAIGEYLSMEGKHRQLEANALAKEYAERNKIAVPKPEIITGGK